MIYHSTMGKTKRFWRPLTAGRKSEPIVEGGGHREVKCYRKKRQSAASTFETFDIIAELGKVAEGHSMIVWALAIVGFVAVFHFAVRKLLPKATYRAIPEPEAIES